MRSLIKKRVLLLIAGFALLAWFIWWAWEYFQITVAGYPADSVLVRLVVIGLVVGAWALTLLVKRLRAARAGAKLMAAVVKQDAKERPSAEALQLRERFEEAVSTLQGRRRGRHGLYELPWYIIIGAPGSGKTTALVNSGLHFPVEQRTGKGALRGVGGTRNCDWWFTDEAVLLDTAGRYTTQDSDAASDSAAWAEFLALLRKYRQRRPVNGVLVAISAQDLMVQAAGAREEHVAAIRRRLTELNDKLGIQLPVYLLVTKCDLVAGFSEYFDDLTHEGRSQVWGVTFPYEQTRNSEAAKSFPEEFDALIERLNARVFGRVQEEGDPRRRARAFGFPQQMAALRPALSELIQEVFGSTRFDRTILLRGVYFTSGTQEGTPIDRLLGAIGRRFAVAPDAILESSRGKAYFIERLLKHVVIPESGLAGVNRRLEVRKAASQVAAYAAMIAIAVIGVIALSVSYARNKSYIQDVQAAITELQKAPAVPASAPVEVMLPRLNAVRQVFDVANVHADGAPWSMGWGLYHGDELGGDAREAYVQVLNGPLLARVAERFRERINDYAAAPLVLYDYLKGYLILRDPRAHPEMDHLRDLAEAEWARPGGAESETGPLMLAHFQILLAEPDGLAPIARSEETDALVRRAQTTVRQASIAQLAYLRLRRASEADTAGALRLDEAAGLRAEEVLRRKDGVSLSTPMLSLYTKMAFEELAAPGAVSEVVGRLDEEQWVWGEDLPPRRSEELESELFDIYEADYIAQWDAVAKAIDDKPLTSPAEAASALQLLSGETSPLRRLLATIAEHTRLVKPPDPQAGSGGLLSGVTKKAGSLVAPILGSRASATSRADVARERITAHFADVHKLVAGDAGTAPIDRVLDQIGQLEETVKKVGGGVGQSSPVDSGTQAAINDQTRELRATAAGLPGFVGEFVTSMAGTVEAVVLRGVRGDLTNLHAQAVLRECRDLVEGRYPLNPRASVEATPADFARVFGYEGVFDQFFSSRLDALVDRSQRPWRWRPSIGNQAPGPAWMVKQFETARYIRDNFFRPGSQMLELSFRVKPLEADQKVKGLAMLIDGQPLLWRQGPEPPVRMTWPGKVGEAQVTFQDGSAVPPSIRYDGNWALFQLLDAGTLQAETEFRHVLTLGAGGYTARVLFEFDSNRNPLHRRDLLQQFRCGS